MRRCIAEWQLRHVLCITPEKSDDATTQGAVTSASAAVKRPMSFMSSARLLLPQSLVAWWCLSCARKVPALLVHRGIVHFSQQLYRLSESSWHEGSCSHIAEFSGRRRASTRKKLLVLSSGAGSRGNACHSRDAVPRQALDGRTPDGFPAWCRRRRAVAVNLILRVFDEEMITVLFCAVRCSAHVSNGLPHEWPPCVMRQSVARTSGTIETAKVYQRQVRHRQTLNHAEGARDLAAWAPAPCHRRFLAGQIKITAKYGAVPLDR